MRAVDTPTKFPTPFANSAGGGFTRPIPEASQVGIQSGAASLFDGFPPVCFLPVGAGGTPPWGADFNGLLNQMSAWNRWNGAGAPVFYDAVWATGTANGYPAGAIVMSALVLGKMWMSIADNNTTDPDSPSSANWVNAPGSIDTGTPVPCLVSATPYGSVPANGLTIGNAASNATNRANSDTWFLFNWVWQNFSNTQCPIFTSTGSASTRGANPAADYAANKALAVPSMKGLGVLGVDTMGGAVSTFLANVPITSGSATVPGSIVGENLHQILLAELATHAHGVTDPTHAHAMSPGYVAGTGAGTGTGVTNPASNNFGTLPAATGISIQNSGSNTAHNTVERNMLVYWNMKL